MNIFNKFESFWNGLSNRAKEYTPDDEIMKQFEKFYNELPKPEETRPEEINNIIHVDFKAKKRVA